MKRISKLAAIYHAAAEGVAATSFTNTHHHHRVIQSTALNINTTTSTKTHWFSCNDLARQSIANAVIGTRFFSTVPLKFKPKDVVLYQYETCFDCNKVKAFLDYYDVPYKTVEVNPISHKEIEWSVHDKVPILMVDGHQMVHSTDIIDELFKKFHPEVSSDDEETKWRGWVDIRFLFLITPNLYRTPSEALETFSYRTTHEHFSFTSRIVVKYVGATITYLKSKKFKKRHDITDERAALYDAAEEWVKALKGRDFLGDSKPNLADLALFGVLRPIWHLKCGRDMVNNTRIGDWYSRMEYAVGPSSKLQHQVE